MSFNTRPSPMILGLNDESLWILLKMRGTSYTRQTSDYCNVAVILLPPK